MLRTVRNCDILATKFVIGQTMDWSAKSSRHTSSPEELAGILFSNLVFTLSLLVWCDLIWCALNTWPKSWRRHLARVDWWINRVPGLKLYFRWVGNSNCAGTNPKQSWKKRWWKCTFVYLNLNTNQRPEAEPTDTQFSGCTIHNHNDGILNFQFPCHDHSLFLLHSKILRNTTHHQQTNQRTHPNRNNNDIFMKFWFPGSNRKRTSQDGTRLISRPRSTLKMEWERAH